jgi:hypothetical protein
VTAVQLSHVDDAAGALLQDRGEQEHGAREVGLSLLLGGRDGHATTGGSTGTQRCQHE